MFVSIFSCPANCDCFVPKGQLEISPAQLAGFASKNTHFLSCHSEIIDDTEPETELKGQNYDKKSNKEIC